VSFSACVVVNLRSLIPMLSAVAICESQVPQMSTWPLFSAAIACAPTPVSTKVTSLFGSSPASAIIPLMISTSCAPYEITPIVLPLKSVIVLIGLDSSTTGNWKLRRMLR
jgi:hypothetical protein